MTPVSAFVAGIAVGIGSIAATIGVLWLIAEDDDEPYIPEPGRYNDVRSSTSYSRAPHPLARPRN